MRIQMSSRVLEDTVLVEVHHDGRLELTLKMPLKNEFERIDEVFDLEDDAEYVDWIEGLVLPYGYVAVGVFKGGSLQRILLVGRGISLTVFSEAAVYDAIATNEARIEEELRGFGK